MTFGKLVSRQPEGESEDGAHTSEQVLNSFLQRQQIKNHQNS